MMKILFYIRQDYLKNMAGDTIQFLKTHEYLSKLGVDISISHNPQEDLSPYDLVHLFNTIRVQDTYRFFKNARKYKKKTVISPIYWNYIDYIPQKQKNEMMEIYWKESDRLRYEIFNNVDMILVSAEIEMREIEKRFNGTKPYEVIPNGVDSRFIHGASDDNLIIKDEVIKDFVLCVGRICQHKNQLSLSKVTNKLKLPFVMVGPVNNLKYYHECLKENPNLIYLSKIEHHQLVAIYKAAKVHALASWYEIPGLANLEAGLAGCNILTTKEGSTREYLRNYADYVDPSNLEDIYLKLINAMEKAKTKDLSNYIEKNYLWDRIAEKIFKTYELLLIS